MKLPGQKGTVFFLVLVAFGSYAEASHHDVRNKRERATKPAVRTADKPSYTMGELVQCMLREGAICPIDQPGCTPPTGARVFRYQRDGHYLRVGKKPSVQKQCEACAVVPKLVLKKCKGPNCKRVAERAQSHCEQRYCSYMPAHRHDGADMGFGMDNSIVRNAFHGRVAMVRNYNDSSTGKLVVVESKCDGIPFTQWNMHFARVARDLKVGERIETGDPIGRIGASGTWGSSAHLHYSIRVGPLDSKKFVDPTAIFVMGSRFMKFEEHETEMAPEPIEAPPTSEDELIAVAEKMGYMEFKVEDVEEFPPSSVDVTATAKPELRREGAAVVVIHDPEHMAQPLFR